jgi:hypothetical protein
MSERTQMVRSNVVPLRGGATPSFVVGHLVELTAAGDVWVDFDGNPLGPMRSAVLNSVIDAVSLLQTGAAIAVTFEGGDRTKPLLLGVIAGAVTPTARQPTKSSHLQPGARVVDGRTILFDAGEELVLRCGGASITLTASGRIVIKGTDLVSRASGVNKIKGGQVNVN